MEYTIRIQILKEIPVDSEDDRSYDDLTIIEQDTLHFQGLRKAIDCYVSAKQLLSDTYHSGDCELIDIDVNKKGKK